MPPSILALLLVTLAPGAALAADQVASAPLGNAVHSIELRNLGNSDITSATVQADGRQFSFTANGPITPQHASQVAAPAPACIQGVQVQFRNGAKLQAGAEQNCTKNIIIAREGGLQVMNTADAQNQHPY